MKKALILMVLALAVRAHGQGAVFAAWQQKMPTEPDIRAWQFALGFGIPYLPGKSAITTVGYFQIDQQTMHLQTWDSTLRFNGDFDAPMTVTPISARCVQYSGTLTGNFHYLNYQGHTRFLEGVHADYSQVQCTASNPVQQIWWLGGGSMTIFVKEDAR